MNDTTEVIANNAKKSKLLPIWIGLIALFCLIAVYYYHYLSKHPSTDDAYVNANVAQISAQINGPVNATYVQNNQLVPQGQLLLTIDPRPFELELKKANAKLLLTEQQIKTSIAAVAAAKANLMQAEANYEVAAKNVPRSLILVKAGELPQSQGVSEQGQLDVTKAAVAAAQSQLQEAIQTLGDPGSNNANLAAAKASLEQAQLNLSYTKIVAPAAGYLVNFSIRPGSMITANQPLFALIETSSWWVDANFKETDLANIRIGQKAKIVLDIYPGHTFKGVVQSISSGSGAAFSLLPAENATGNWVKVTQRFPVKIIILHPEPQFPLRVGASAAVTINTTS